MNSGRSRRWRGTATQTSCPCSGCATEIDARRTGVVRWIAVGVVLVERIESRLATVLAGEVKAPVIAVLIADADAEGRNGGKVTGIEKLKECRKREVGWSRPLKAWLAIPISPRRYHPPQSAAARAFCGMSAATATADGRMNGAAPTSAEMAVRRTDIPFPDGPRSNRQAGVKGIVTGKS